MTVQDLFDNELPLSYQYNTIGIPKDDESVNSPNTHQYTNANGKLRWRSSSKTTEELLAEERRRNQELQSQMQTAQSQLTGMQPQASIQPNVSQTQAVDSPMLDNAPFLNSDAVNALSGFAKLGLQKLKTRKQDESGTVSDGTVPDLDESRINLNSAREKGSENLFVTSMQQD